MAARRSRTHKRAPDAPAAAPRLDKWKVIGPGGGGAQYIPTVSPHDSDTVFVRCDMTGSYLSRDGGRSWRMFNLSGVVRFFVFDPTDPDTMYAQSNALYRSTDGGKTWKLVHPAPGSIRGIRMGDDHARVELVTAGRYRDSIIALAVDPADSKTLYAAVERDSKVGFAISRDHGVTWKRTETLPDGAMKIYVDPDSPPDDRTVYVVANRSSSVLTGGSWTHQPVAPGVERFIDVSAGFDRDGSLVIYAAAPAKWRGSKLTGGILVSPDGGRTWRHGAADLARQSAGRSKDPHIRGVACCLTRPEVAYIGYKNFKFIENSECFGCATTRDMGETWQVVLKETDPGKSAPNMHDAWLSERFGPIWGDAPRYLGIDPHNPRRCFTTDDGRTMRTLDGGKTWRACYSKKRRGGWTTTGLDVLTCYGVHRDPAAPERIFISYTDIGLMVSEDGGVSWQSATVNGVPRPWVNTTYWIAFDSEVKGRVWGVMSGVHDLPRPKMWRHRNPATYNGGVCISDDAGRTWKRSTRGMGETACTHVLIDPDSAPDARVLYVAGFGTGVWKSVNGAGSWKLMNNGIEGDQPFAWRLARDRNGTLYLVVARRSDDGGFGNDEDGALYRSQDGAESWQKLTLPRGTNGPNDLAIDPKDPDRLYLGAWGRSTRTGAAGGGVWLSEDAGRTWKNVLSDDQHIYGITIDEKNRKVVYACGFESSVRRSDDAGLTWKRLQGYDFKWGHRVFPDQLDRKMIFVTTFGGSVWYGPAKGDQRASETIVTPSVRPL